MVGFINYAFASLEPFFVEKPKKSILEGKQFLRFSDPLGEAGGHSDSPKASKDRNYYGGLIRWLL